MKKGLGLLVLFFAISLFSGTRSLEAVEKKKTGFNIPYKKSYALLIGVSDYTNGWPDLDSIPDELQAFKKTLRKHGFIVETILNPKGDALFKSYENFIDKYGYEPNNRLLFLYAGHGYTTNNGRKGYLVPADAPNPNLNLKDFKRRAMSMGRLITLAREMESKHALFLFDSCFSGSIFKTRALPKIPPYISNSLMKPVRQFITSGSANEEVPSISSFMPMLRDAIDGDADMNGDGYVTGSELGVYLMQNLPNYEDQSPQYGKIKDYELSRGDFIFVSPAKKPIPPVQKKKRSATQVAPAKKSVKTPVATRKAKTVRNFPLTVTTNPDNCIIHIYGKKDYTYNKTILLPKGRYKVVVSKDGYVTKSRTVSLDHAVDIHIGLEKKKDLSKKMFFGF